jgi:riboflavin kinase/FMN adenylyltransferase
MQIHRGYDNLRLVRPVITLGIFDGVHLGHRMLLDRLLIRAAEKGGDSVVITFSPHPRMVLEKKSAGLTFLSTMEEKCALLEQLNIGHLVIIEFTKEFSRMQACDFVNEVLVKKIRAEYLIIGYDHHFGWKGEGDYETIRKCTEKLGITVEQVKGLVSGNLTISSSLVREALLKGRVEEAGRLLGYGYSLTGTVVEGKKLGRSLGFPTANIKPYDSHKLIPFRGVYAVEVKAMEKVLPGLLSIGSNPTVNRDPGLRSIEVYIMNFEDDLYGNEITIVFRKRLRDEIRFESVDKLIEQMEADKRSAMRFFKSQL